ncbi:MAG: CHAP domain-containing protein [Bacteroidota bacterium]
MKKLRSSFARLIMVYFLSSPLAHAQILVKANGQAIGPRDTTASVVFVEDKQFLSLTPEAAPKEMVWGTFGSKIESYHGVTAYSNGARKTNRKYQCTELIHRFLSDVYGIPSKIGQGLGHAKDLAHNIAQRYRSKIGNSPALGNYQIRLENFSNQRSVYPPVVGAIVSMHFNRSKKGYGHVGIIRSITQNEDGSLKATLFDQHGFIHRKENIPIQSDVILFKKDTKGNWGGQVTSWLHQSNYEVISWTNPVMVKK